MEDNLIGFLERPITFSVPTAMGHAVNPSHTKAPITSNRIMNHMSISIQLRLTHLVVDEEHFEHDLRVVSLGGRAQLLLLERVPPTHVVLDPQQRDLDFTQELVLEGGDHVFMSSRHRFLS